MRLAPRVSPPTITATFAAILILVSVPSSAQEKPAENTAQSAPAAIAGPDFRHISDSAMAAVIIRPRLFFSSPGRETLPTEVFRTLSIARWGFDITKLDQAVFLINGKEPGKVSPACILRFSEPAADRKKVADAVLSLLPPINDLRMAFGVPKEERNCMLYMSVDEMPAMQEASGDARTPLLEKLRRQNPANMLAGAVEMDSLKVLLAARFTPTSSPLPPELREYAESLKSLSSTSFQLNLAQGIDVRLEFVCRDEQAAATLEKLLRKSLGELGAFFDSRATEIPEEGDAELKQALNRYFRRMLGVVERQMEFRRKESSLAVRFKDDSAQAISSVVAGILIPVRDQMQKDLAMLRVKNNLLQIGLAIQNFQDVFRRIPTSSYDKDGRPLLSWRVYILPFVEHRELFYQFHLDEPWNSEHNLSLIEQMPEVYRDPEHGMPFRTRYLRPVGKGALFVKGKDDEGRDLPEIAAWITKEREQQGWTKKLTIEDVSDGTASTIMLVEADPARSVIWTKPDDFEFDAEQPLAGLSHAKSKGFHVLFVDGHIRFLPQDIEKGKLQLLLDPSDGQTVELGQ